MKSYKLHIAMLLAFLLCLNPFSLQFLSEAGMLSRYFAPESEAFFRISACSMVLNLWEIVAIAWLFRTKHSLKTLFQTSAGFNFSMFLAAFWGMLAVNPIYAGKFQWLRLIFPLLCVFLLGRSFWLAVIKRTSLPKWLRNLATLAFSLLALLLILEGIFMFISLSHQYDGTLASKVWFARHWNLNSQGCRDAEPAETNDGRKKIFLMGDSFVAGHGIKDQNQRFGNLLQGQFSSKWKFCNLGVNGFGTNDQLEQLQHFPIKPDQVILFWYLNDIEECAWKNGFGNSSNVHRSSIWRAFSLVDGSYLLNYLWWSYPHPAEGEDYLTFLENAFTNEAVQACHLAELNAIADYCRANKIELTFASFPMNQEAKQKPFVKDFLERFIQTQNSSGNSIPHFDLANAFDEKFGTYELQVNKFDAHPSEFANELIFEYLRRQLDPLRFK